MYGTYQSETKSITINHMILEVQMLAYNVKEQSVLIHACNRATTMELSKSKDGLYFHQAVTVIYQFSETKTYHIPYITRKILRAILRYKAFNSYQEKKMEKELNQLTLQIALAHQ